MALCRPSLLKFCPMCGPMSVYYNNGFSVQFFISLCQLAHQTHDIQYIIECNNLTIYQMGGLSGFMQAFVAEVLSNVRANVSVL